MMMQMLITTMLMIVGDGDDVAYNCGYDGYDVFLITMMIIMMRVLNMIVMISTGLHVDAPPAKRHCALRLRCPYVLALWWQAKPPFVGVRGCTLGVRGCTLETR